MAVKNKMTSRAADETSGQGAKRQLPGGAELPAGGLLPGRVGLKLLVFVAGAVLMGLEIVGSRLLAPYFGNSVFVWGSLISLFLIALSAGYYLGGMLADKRPSQALLNSIVIAVAVSLFVIAGISGAICEAVSQANFGEKAGPFVASALLFLLPSLGMGVVSPFAVRLATHTVAAVGKTAGMLYALSTFGSIAGTMLTTFVLIPSMGAGAILKGLAGALLAAAVATYPFASRKGAATLIAVATLAASGAAYAINPARLHLEIGSKLVVDVDTPYHHISVVDVPPQNGRGETRELRFDKYTESSIELAPPYPGVAGYTSYFHLAFLPQPRIKRALFIGAGGGIGPRTFHAHDPKMQIEVVDIDAKVLEIAKTQFYMEDVPQIQTIAADGRQFVRGAASGTYDCIVLDAFSIGGRIPFHLVTREFIALCKDRLAPGGVFMMNTNSAQRGPKAQIFYSMYKTINAVFPGTTYAFALYRSTAPLTTTTNVILVGIDAKQPATLDDWETWAERYESTSYVSRDDIQGMLEDLVVTLPEMEGAPMFTDDYAPIETMPF